MVAFGSTASLGGGRFAVGRRCDHAGHLFPVRFVLGGQSSGICVGLFEVQRGPSDFSGSFLGVWQCLVGLTECVGLTSGCWRIIWRRWTLQGGLIGSKAAEASLTAKNSFVLVSFWPHRIRFPCGFLALRDFRFFFTALAVWSLLPFLADSLVLRNFYCFLAVLGLCGTCSAGRLCRKGERDLLFILPHGLLSVWRMDFVARVDGLCRAVFVLQTVVLSFLLLISLRALSSFCRQGLLFSPSLRCSHRESAERNLVGVLFWRSGSSLYSSFLFWLLRSLCKSDRSCRPSSLLLCHLWWNSEVKWPKFSRQV